MIRFIDILNYVIYLPYEVEKITFEVTAADTTASIEKEEVETLSLNISIFSSYVIFKCIISNT